MKTTQTASMVAVVLACISATTYASKESMTVTEDDITFTVDRFHDGRSKPYVVRFDQEDVSSKYKFNTDGVVTNIKVGSERYRVQYKSNGDLKRVRRTDSGARMLEMEDVEDVEEDRTSGQRRLYACHDCEEAWDAVCAQGVPSVCSIVGYGYPLTDAASESLQTLCDSFGNACSRFDGPEACEGQCVCVRSLAISLEWYSDGDLDLHVTEPGGVEVFYGNRNGDVGFLDNDNLQGPGAEPENYLLYSGLSTDTDNMLGDYDVVVEKFSGSGSIRWTLTATSNGEELWVEEGVFTDESAASDTFTATVSEYIDNGCENAAPVDLAAIEGSHEKYQALP